MAGYQRQSAADIVPTAVVRAAPINNEYNALRDAFVLNGGHRHDGSATEGAHVPLIADADALNKVAVDTTNNRVGVFVEVGAAAVEQVRVQDGAIVPVTDNDIDLGTASLEFKDLYIDGTANIDSLIADTADINAGTIDATVIGATTPAAATVTNLTVNTAAVIASADINAGTIDGTVIGATATQAITGTLVTATTGFVGGLTGAVTGNTAGTHTGPVVGAVTGNVTGNVTASSGTSTFNDVTINGGLNMNAGTAATITNLSTPTNSGDAATKGYVDTADALKLNLSGGTMSGVIAMGTNKITGLGTPTLTADAATKGYVDTAVSNLIDTAPGTLDTLNELAAALGDDPNFATTIAASVATKLPLAGGTMSGAIAMGANKITGLGNPTLTQDAATKTYVDTADALKLNLSGGTMSGAIAMGTNKITGVGDPTVNQDVATKLYVDTADALKLSLTGGTMSGAIAMGGSKITGLGTPTADADSTTKLYVDGILGSATSAATSAAAAAVSASNASTSASNASTSESNASTSATAAAASYDSFDDRYLGSKTSDPSLDNDGNALLTGALYFNSTSGEMRVYSGSAWLATYLPASGYLALSGGTMTGSITFAGGQTFPGTGTVTSVSVVSANGLAGTVANSTTTPAITLSTSITGVLKGNGTAISAAVAGTDYVTPTGTETLTNKRITSRVVSTTSASSLTPSVATADVYAYTALAANLTINAPTGTPVNGDKLIFRFLDNGTTRTLTWNATYTVIGTTLPTATTASKMLYVGCIYNAANTRWDVIAVTTQV